MINASTEQKAAGGESLTGEELKPESAPVESDDRFRPTIVVPRYADQKRVTRAVARRVVPPIINFYTVLRFTFNAAGAAYGTTALQKFRLAMAFIRNSRRIKSLSTWQQHLSIAEELLCVPPTIEGDVVECGCYNGASTANLSLVCHLVGRRLFVCDSFEGLPQPREDEEYTVLADQRGSYYHWQKGEYSSTGGLAGVVKTVERFGRIEACEFVQGYFCDTLENLQTESVVLVIEDADLVSSVEDCLRHLWPKLKDDCVFFCHEPFSFEVVSLFFDKLWWADNLDSVPPGFVGSGVGSPVRGIGHARKISKEHVLRHGEKMAHLGSRGFGDA